MGVIVSENNGIVYLEVLNGLYGMWIFMDMVFVGVMINVILVVVCVEGVMIIENVVWELEIVDFVIFLNNMGV